jgi:hypothetical protein
MKALLLRHSLIWLVAINALIAVWPAIAETVEAANSPPTRAVELTFLKSLPGQRENLRRFLVANWFAMDAIAVKQGLMTGYAVMQTETDDGLWDTLVAVTYTDARGYAGIAEAFERIRSAHKTQLIEGKPLAELGRIVDSKKLLEEIPPGGRCSAKYAARVFVARIAASACIRPKSNTGFPITH